MISLMILLFLQGTVILIDEFYFHFRREVPKWERLGHPLDTLFLVLPLGLLALIPALSGEVYLGLSVFSCLFITKDEWVHKTYCSAFENWLHALLFILHPLVLLSAWNAHAENTQIIFWVLPPMGVFLIYQIIYWNFYEPKLSRS